MSLTLNELCSKYNVSESSVTTNFNRTQKTILNKYGVLIRKEGRGKKVSFIEDREKSELISDGRALTMFKEAHDDMVFNNESLNLINADFLVFLGIVSTPMAMFRGTAADFLRYIGVKVDDDNLNMLDDALLNLVDRELIFYDVDDDVIILYIRRRAEKEMRLGIEMIQRCRQIAEANHKHKDGWMKLLKVWLAIEICSEEQPFTMDRVAEITGLSKYQITDCKKLLEEDNLFKTSRTYKFMRCLGSNVDLNNPAFYK